MLQRTIHQNNCLGKRLNAIDFCGKLRGKVETGGTAARLSRAAFPVISNMNLFNRRLNPFVHGDRVLETVQNFIGRVLKPRVGLMQFAGRLGGQLAQLVAVRDVR
jgi:hypothetical protein